MANEKMMKLKSQYHQYVRVWKLLKRPTMPEFLTISKVSAIGLLVMGLMGFIISIAVTAVV